MLLILLTFSWSKPMWSTLVPSSYMCVYLATIVEWNRHLVNRIIEIMWASCKICVQLAAIFVHGFVVLTENPKRYQRRTYLQNIARRATTMIFTSCDAFGTWMDKQINVRRRVARTVHHHHHRYKQTMLAMSVLAMHAHAHTERPTRFDTDSAIVGIDNRCSGCISHVREDFIGLLRPTTRVIKGFGGSRTMNVSIGTLRWRWEDDQGRHHEFNIPNSYYVPDGHIRLLSPQHWAQADTNNRTKRTERGEHTNGNECVLYWAHGAYKRHIPLGKHDNVATITLSPGYQQFEAFCSEAGVDDDNTDPVVMPSQLVSDDEGEDEVTTNPNHHDTCRSSWSSPPASRHRHHL
jgi:hypothetical protein